MALQKLPDFITVLFLSILSFRLHHILVHYNYEHKQEVSKLKIMNLLRNLSCKSFNFCSYKALSSLAARIETTDFYGEF